MAIPENKIRISVVITKEAYEKISGYADKFDVSETKFAANLLEGAINEDEWVYKLLSSRYTGILRKVFRVKLKEEKLRELEKTPRLA